MGSEQRPNQLLIALEPEAASIYCRKLKLNQLIKPELMGTSNAASPVLGCDSPKSDQLLEKCFEKGTRYMVVDCGGGTVDITVHEIQDGRSDKRIRLKEIYYGGGPFGSVSIDRQFELVLMRVFGQEFIEKYKLTFPSGYVDLMNSFEARKRTATVVANGRGDDQLAQTLNITLPFSFISAFKKHGSIEAYLKRFHTANREFVDKNEITYCSKLGMIRLKPSFMYKRLFQPITDEIVKHISQIIVNDEVNNSERPLKFLFLVGGLAENQIVQHVVRSTFAGSATNDRLAIEKLGDLLADQSSLDRRSSVDRSSVDRPSLDRTNGSDLLNKSGEKYQLAGQKANETLERLNLDCDTDLDSDKPNGRLEAGDNGKRSKDSGGGSVFKRSLNRLIKLDSSSKSIKSTGSSKKTNDRNKINKSIVVSSAQQQSLRNLEILRLRKKCQFLKLIVPQEVSSATLKGACMYGLDPNVITVRRSRLVLLNWFINNQIDLKLNCFQFELVVHK